MLLNEPPESVWAFGETKETSFSMSAVVGSCPDLPAPNLFDTHTVLCRLTDCLAKPSNILNTVNNAQRSTDITSQPLQCKWSYLIWGQTREVQYWSRPRPSNCSYATTEPKVTKAILLKSHWLDQATSWDQQRRMDVLGAKLEASFCRTMQFEHAHCYSIRLLPM